MSWGVAGRPELPQGKVLHDPIFKKSESKART